MPTKDIIHDEHPTLTEEEKAKLIKLYGKLPDCHDITLKKLYNNDHRKYFDSGDYALSKSTPSIHPSSIKVGSLHPSPDKMPRSRSRTSLNQDDSPCTTNSTDDYDLQSIPKTPNSTLEISPSPSPVRECCYRHKTQQS